MQATQTVTAAERTGGSTYEAGWGEAAYTERRAQPTALPSAASMTDAHAQSKAATMAAVYIGFRCARDAR